MTGITEYRTNESETCIDTEVRTAPGRKANEFDRFAVSVRGLSIALNSGGSVVRFPQRLFQSGPNAFGC